MLDPQGFVATCNSTHFFVVRRGEVWTSSGAYCLGGITRGNVLRVCREAGIPSRERRFSLTEVYCADEAFVTGTFAGVVPVHTVDGRTIGSGSRGPMVAGCRSCTPTWCGATSPGGGAPEDRAARLLVRAAQHLDGHDAGLGEPARHRGRRRAALRLVPRPHRPRPPRPRGGDRGAARPTGAASSSLPEPWPDGRRSSTRSTWRSTSSPRLPREWIASLRNVLLIRDPAEVVASYLRSRATVDADDIGLLQQQLSCSMLAGAEVPVIDSADFLRDAGGVPAVAVRLRRRRVHRRDAGVAGRATRDRRRVGAVLVRRRPALDRLRAVPAPPGRADRPRPCGRATQSSVLRTTARGAPPALAAGGWPIVGQSVSARSAGNGGPGRSRPPRWTPAGVPGAGAPARIRSSRGFGPSVRPVCGRRLPARYGAGQTAPGPA